MAYDACNTIIIEIDPELSAAEAHGMATGMLCINSQTASDTWLTELSFDKNSMTNETIETLSRFFEDTRDLLNNDEFEYDLFLPDANVPLAEQAEAVKNWCRGFLFGVGSVASDIPKNALEILKDIAEFTKLDDNVDGEEDEHALMEITEYLRSTALLLRDELGSDSNNMSALPQNGE
jgi:uncharacterized protein YgfB (UPF0149 family)